MRKWLFCMLMPLCLQAQFVDEFSDGNYHTGPTWTGDTANYEIDNFRLHLDAPIVDDIMYLSTPCAAINNATWEFYVEMGFNPSASNFSKVYLSSSGSDLKGPLNGYYVRVSGSSADKIGLFRQDIGGTETEIIPGNADIVDMSPVNARIQVTRDSLGNWELLADTSGGTAFVSQGTVLDATHNSSAHFGVYCEYTSSRSDLFWFDDFDVTGQPFIDNDPPTISLLEVISANELDITFSEPMDQATTETEVNFTVNNGIGNPDTALLDGVNPALVHLTFGTAFGNGVLNEIVVLNAEDLFTNPSNDTAQFSFYTPLPGDVIITEIMCDPTPGVHLPRVEFVELYNTTNLPIDLTGWEFTDPTTMGVIPGVILPPDTFIILCSNSSVDSFTANGINALLTGISAWPSLNNSGDLISLYDDNANLIDQVDYTDGWYHDPTKDNGGWTLELIDADSPCSGEFNWNASIDTSGGTPGKTNSVTGVFQDTVSPAIVSLAILNPTTLEVIFSEPVDTPAAALAANYSCDGGIGAATGVTLSPDLTVATLTFGNTLVAGTIYTLSISNLADCFGNALDPDTAQFAIPQQAERFDILINEIHPLPEPVVGLPPFEFVELYNRSNKTIELKDWTISDAGTSTTIDNYQLLPNEFVILVAVANVSAFSAIPNVRAVSSLPSQNNDGDQVILTNDQGEVIHFIEYDGSWFQDALKEDGGWTLELIDPNEPCGGSASWRASVNPDGGTPGEENSVLAENPDETPPDLIKAIYSDSRNIVLQFSEFLDESLASNPANYTVSNGVNTPDSAVVVIPDLNLVRLKFSAPLQQGIIYSVKVANVTDCSGNVIGLLDSARFGIPAAIDSNDMVINEVLFNPASGGVDFVEVYNNSDKILDFLNLRMASRDEETGLLNVVEEITTVGCLIFPGEYIVITEDPSLVKDQYYTPNPNNFIEISDLPNMDDGEDEVIVMTQVGQIIDELQYSHDWHFPLIDDENGVSLERINYSTKSQAENNWHSAAQTVGFATPAYQNSNFGELAGASDNISVQPQVFSPNGDGMDDLLTIEYGFEQSGFLANITLFDARGREIRKLVRNELLGFSGFYTWDGTTDEGTKARIGAYVVFVEIFDDAGNVDHFKKTAVLAGHLK